MRAIKKRRLGRTNLFVTELGLGAMDTPTSKESHETIDTAEDVGINFIDTAREYSGSEFLLGQHLRNNPKSKLIITSKTFSHTLNGSQHDIDRSLSTLGLSEIPLYQLHDISTFDSWSQVNDEENGAITGLKIAKYRGLINYLGVSCHNPDLLTEIIQSNIFDTIMVEYSAFYPSTAAIIEMAARHDIGVIVMRPLGGSGRMSAIRNAIEEGYEGLLTPANLLRYVLTNPNVSVAIPGARYPSRIKENFSTAISYQAMSKSECKAIEIEAANLY
ncbi:MAG: hypothetical protein CL792_03545 [Chloroflexi bacterium]|nr:hypothetical protein [Chloroflexota bacterium]|tara:strand:- start:7309 stop:8130 length:822 start_codon:yes stop_codon:yes gene_type:complete